MDIIKGLIETALNYATVFAILAVLALAAIPMIKGNFKQGLVRLGMGIAGILVLVAGSNILGFAVSTVNDELDKGGVKGDIPSVSIPNTPK